MVDNSVIPDELKAFIGIDSPAYSIEIERGHLKRFVEAIGDPNPQWLSEASPTFLITYGPLEVNNLFRSAWNKSGLKRILNGGSQVEYFRPAEVGDTISFSGKLIDVYEREGKSGKMLFTVTEITYRNQRNEVAAKGRFTFIRY